MLPCLYADEERLPSQYGLCRIHATARIPGQISRTHPSPVIQGTGLSFSVSLQTLTSYLQVQDIFRIERNGEEKRFEQSPYAKLQGSDRRLLWHGSRVTNYGGILSQGLRIAPPEAPVNGYAFGKGVYLVSIPHPYSCPSSGKQIANPLC